MNHIDADLLREMPLPNHESGESKEGRGTVLVIGGSVEVPGGATLAATAALRAGAGRLQIATCRSLAAVIGVTLPEALVMGLPETIAGGISPYDLHRLVARANRANAVLIGPGMTDHDAIRGMVCGMLATVDGPCFVLDAGALGDLVSHPPARQALARHAGRVILTPHAGEMARMLDMPREEVEADPLQAGRQTAALLQCVVVMKGSRTHVVSPQGEAWLFDDGNVGLATSGSGDTLAGVIAGLLARGAAPLRAAIWGVFLHGQAGNRLLRQHGGIGFLASELLAEIPSVMSEAISKDGALPQTPLG